MGAKLHIACLIASPGVLPFKHRVLPDAARDDQPGPFRITIQGSDRNGRLLLIDSVFTR